MFRGRRKRGRKSGERERWKGRQGKEKENMNHKVLSYSCILLLSATYLLLPIIKHRNTDFMNLVGLRTFSTATPPPTHPLLTFCFYNEIVFF